jgi:hypothetical protein
MKRNRAFVATIAACALGASASAQDSVSKDPCLPGDAVSPWADSDATNGSEQCNEFVVDLTSFSTSWGTTFGVAPLIKTSKPTVNFFTSLTSSQSISRAHLIDVPFPSDAYMVWSAPGFGVNNDPAINDPGTLLDVTGMMSNQFAVVMRETSSTDGDGFFEGILGGLVNYMPDDPSRLYVKRILAGSGGCDPDANLASFGIGAVDADGNVHVRADNPPGAGSGCGLTELTGDNIFRIAMADRDCEIQNVVSDDFPGGLFDGPATEWLVRNSSTTHNTPTIMPACVTEGAPLLLGTNFDGEYVRGPAFGAIASDSTHLCGDDQRGNLSYTSKNFSRLASDSGIAAILAKNGALTTILNVFGLDEEGEVTGALCLELPDDIADCEGNTPFDGPNEFDHYHDQVAFDGGNGQIALTVDRQGNLLAAAVAYHPDQFNSNPENYIAVARVAPDGTSDWTIAALIVSEETDLGTPILDSSGGEVIGRLTDELGGPSMSAPMFDSIGNIWFLSSVDLIGQGQTTGLVRSVYNEDAFCYELELVLAEGDVFDGRNSDREYQIVRLSIEDDDSIASGSAWSQNISEKTVDGLDPSPDLPTSDPTTLGGLVIAADIVYDYDQDGVFVPCDEDGENDQSYQVMLYVGSVGPELCPWDLDGNDAVNVFDLLQLLGAWGPCPGCPEDIDGNGVINVFDLLELLGNWGPC